MKIESGHLTTLASQLSRQQLSQSSKSLAGSGQPEAGISNQLRQANAAFVEQSASFQSQPDEDVPPVYARPTAMQIWQNIESNEDYIKRTDQARTLLNQTVPAKLQQLKRHFSEFERNVSQQLPGLADKNWGFSLNEQDQLTLLDPLQQLTVREQQQLQQMLDEDKELASLANSFKTSLLEGLALDRGPAMASQGPGQYNLNTQNFADILDIRQLLPTKTMPGLSRDGGGGLLAEQLQLRDNILNQLRQKAESKYPWQQHSGQIRIG